MLVAQYYCKNVYGRSTMYPVGDVAMGVARIAGTKTLNPRDIVTAREHFGITWRAVGDPSVASMLSDCPTCGDTMGGTMCDDGRCDTCGYIAGF